MLEVKGINTFYGHAHVLFDASLAVREGECVSLLGRNGAGKTTTLRSIMNLTPPQGGEVVFMGRALGGLMPYQVAKAGIAMVPEDRRIFPTLSVEENLSLGAKRNAQGQAPWTLERIYDMFPKMAELRERSGGNLSGGEQQILSITRALMGNPQLLMLDEPTEGLAPIVVEDLVEAIHKLKRERMTVLLVEQNLNVALDLADRCYVLDHGQVVREGSAEAIRRDDGLRHDLLGV
ncbi:ABC transporter ATP-binding protein [Castellaniella sp.]|uniref:ABC transporter ATP-binding protein n=1 Tax=Castellaniella sp. TaxID=1955812 RepID=UPI003C76A5AC